MHSYDHTPGYLCRAHMRRHICVPASGYISTWPSYVNLHGGGGLELIGSAYEAEEGSMRQGQRGTYCDCPFQLPEVSDD